MQVIIQVYRIIFILPQTLNMSGTFDVQIAKEGNALHAAADREAGVNLIAAGTLLAGMTSVSTLMPIVPWQPPWENPTAWY